MSASREENPALDAVFQNCWFLVIENPMHGYFSIDHQVGLCGGLVKKVLIAQACFAIGGNYVW